MENIEKEVVVSISKWYDRYRKERGTSVKIENKPALVGFLKSWLVGSILVDVFAFLFGFLPTMLFEGPVAYQGFTLLFGLPITLLLVFGGLFVYSLILRNKIEKHYENICWCTVENNFLGILYGGCLGWYELFVYIGVGKKERKRIEKKITGQEEV